MSDCPNCRKGFHTSCRLATCPKRKSPLEALQRYVRTVDEALFDEGRLPTIAEWSALAEMVRDLVPAAPPASPAAIGGNVVAFKPRGA